jgi:hypothetical protein
MAPQFVKPYVKTNKHDAADAEAICEAVRRPNMRFVPVKNVEQQAVLALHTKSECTGAIFTFTLLRIECLANRGHPCTPNKTCCLP